MRRGLALLLLIVVVGSPAVAGFEPPGADRLNQLGLLVMSIDGWDVYSCVEELTRDAPNQYRLMGTPSHDAFLEKYGSVFTDRYGYASTIQHFDNGSASVGGVGGPIKGGDNLIAVLPGADLTKWVVMGGHYDTREATAGGGAYDNTSGICTILAIAGAMKELGVTPQASIVFAWWDGEEFGLFGSRAFLADPSPAKVLLGLAPDAQVEILSATSFDMVGLNYPAYNTWARYGKPDVVLETAVLNIRTAPVDVDNFTLCPSYGCYKYDQYTDEQLQAFVDYRALVEWVAYDYLQFPREFVWVYDDQYGRSDHVPFIAAGIPGMRVQGSHDEEYPHYHQPTDTLPALVELASSETHLRAGFDKAADLGGLSNLLIALQGFIVPPPAPVVESPLPTPAKASPAASLVPALAVAMALALGRRRNP